MPADQPGRLGQVLIRRPIGHTDTMPDVRFGRLRVPLRKSPALGLMIGDLARSSQRFVSAAQADDRRRLHDLERAFAKRLFSRLQVNLDVAGLEHINPDTTYLVVSMHESLLDPIVLQHLPLDLRFLARSELANEPLVGRYLTATDQLLVSPEQGWRGVRRVLHSAPDIVAAGESLVMFPQGSVLGLEIAFAGGLAWLADKLGWPILPVVLTGGHRIWEHPFSPTVRFAQPVSMRVLQPFEAAHLNVEALQREMKEIAQQPGWAPVRRFDPSTDGWWDDYSFDIDPAFDELAAETARHRNQMTTPR